MSKDLKPCPFCGGEAEIVYAPNNVYLNTPCFSVACKRCKVMIGTVMFGQTDFYRTIDAAVEVWNNRKPIDDIVEQLEELRLQEEMKKATDFIKRDEELNKTVQSHKAGRIFAYDKAIEIVKEGQNGKD